MLLYNAALESLTGGKNFPLAMLPVSPFLVWCTLPAAIAALAILVLSRYVNHDVAQTLMGIFSGLMIRIVVENGLITIIVPCQWVTGVYQK